MSLTHIARQLSTEQFPAAQQSGFDGSLSHTQHLRDFFVRQALDFAQYHNRSVRRRQARQSLSYHHFPLPLLEHLIRAALTAAEGDSVSSTEIGSRK